MRAWLPAGLVLAAIGVAAVAWLRSDESSWTFSTRTNPSLPPTVVGPPSDPAPREVTREALDIAREDALIRHLAREGRAQFVRATEWWSLQDRLGAKLEFHLRRPLDVDAILPIADIPSDSPTKGTSELPYRQTWLREQSEGVTKLSILVDLRRARVADIATNASSGRRSWVDGKPHPSCQPVDSG